MFNEELTSSAGKRDFPNAKYPTPNGEGGDDRAGVGVLVLTPGLPRACPGAACGKSCRGEVGEASDPGCLAEAIFVDWGSFFQMCLHLLMCCLSMEKTVKLSNSELLW